MTKIAFQLQMNPIANIIIILFVVAAAAASVADAALIMFFCKQRRLHQTDKERNREECEMQYLSRLQCANLLYSIFTHTYTMYDYWLV